MAAVAGLSFSATGGETAELVTSEIVTEGYFDIQPWASKTASASVRASPSSLSLIPAPRSTFGTDHSPS